MKGRTGFVIGLGIGYVLGAKAGRERRLMLEAALDKTTATAAIEEEQPPQQATGPRAKSKAMLSDQLRNASELIRQRTEAASSRNGS